MITYLLEQSIVLPNVDLLPAYESNDRKALNNPIEAHIIAEVKMSSLLSLSLRNFTVLFINVVNMFLMFLFIRQAVRSLVLRGIEGQAIGIITPYNSQANLIRGAVPEHVEIHTIDKYQVILNALSIKLLCLLHTEIVSLYCTRIISLERTEGNNPIHNFLSWVQGRDKDCILVSFVRSSENPRNGTSSLLGDWHRINVALTRAKVRIVPILCLHYNAFSITTGKMLIQLLFA